MAEATLEAFAAWTAVGDATARSGRDADMAVEVRDRFRARFGTDPRVFRAPGRVNLIGEHVDYNEGLVLPMAIEPATYVAVATRADRAVHAVSSIEPAELRIDLDAPAQPRQGTWGDHLQGVSNVLQRLGRRLSGADVYVHSTIVPGAGLSSSAALEVGVALALLALSGECMSRLELAAACQTAEHEWVGTRCGIMDQLAVLCGEADHAVALDCRTLRIQLVPIPLDAVTLVITDSGVHHRLGSSAYNQRRQECEAAVATLQRLAPELRALRDVSPAALAQWQEVLGDPLAARVRHVVNEIARVEAAIGALHARDWTRLGLLMHASHVSLRDDYRVSTAELDLLVDAAMATAGVFGARLTGAGFGGSVVALARREAVPTLVERLQRALFDGFGLQPRSLVTRATAGAGELVSMRSEVTR